MKLPHSLKAPAKSRILPAEELADFIDVFCDQFEAGWKSGQSEPLEDCLQRCDPEARPHLLKELILIELEYRRKRGESATPSEYVDRFPEYREMLFGLGRANTLASPKSNASRASELEDVESFGELSTNAIYCDPIFQCRGGLGEIFRAHDETLKRRVALKFIQRRHLLDHDQRDRFFMEAEVTARLEHPGIVPVYGLGQTADGQPFYAMRFVDGQTLREAIDSYHRTSWKELGRRPQRLELHRLLSHLIAACNTVAYAHNRGIVHRDIKPENIMVGRFRETIVLDWGLAISVERDERARASGEETLMPGVMDDSSSATGAGTIGYMSPEQLPDGCEPIGFRSDIYSLGATLYKLLTGKTPVHGRPGPELWQRIRNGDFPSPRAVSSDAPRALDAICRKAMAVNPAHRYSTPLELAADIQAWMADETVSVYREPRTDRVLRWARRHRSLTMSLAATAVIVLVFSLAAGWWLNAVAQREHAVRIAADQARDRSLLQCANFAAQVTADAIDRRWRILEEMAADAELHQLLVNADGKKPGSEEWIAIQRWLANRADSAFNQIDKPDSCFITDRTGVQVARKPEDPKTLGVNFARRTYFHGRGHDLPADTPLSEITPIEKPYLAHPYRSKSTDGMLRVTLSVPIWPHGPRTPDVKPLGVLGMAVVTGNLKVLDHAMLVDTRTDTIDGEILRGLILQHPKLHGIALEKPQRLAKSDLATLEQVVQKLKTKQVLDLAFDASRSCLLPAFADPLASPPGATTVAAAAPVVISTYRAASAYDTGWIVIVEDNPKPEDNQ